MYNTILNDKNIREPYETFYKLNIGLSIDEFEAQKELEYNPTRDIKHDFLL